MTNAIEVSDSLSNTEEQIERAAKTVGRGARRIVFEAIYHHKAKAKSVGDIARKTGLSRLRVLQEGRHLSRRGIARQTKKNGDTAYEMIEFFHAHKKEILRFAADPKKLAKLPTKRKLGATLPKFVTISSAGATVNRITIDDVRSFAKIRKIKGAGSLRASVTEGQFKRGVQAIIGEPGTFKDWPGEKATCIQKGFELMGRGLQQLVRSRGLERRENWFLDRLGKTAIRRSACFRKKPTCSSFSIGEKLIRASSS